MAVLPLSGRPVRKLPLTPSAPTFATVGAASGQVLAANTNRRSAIFVNTSANVISLGLGGNAAVLNSGITLEASGGSWSMNDYSFVTGAITAIASGGASNLAIQEFTR